MWSLPVPTQPVLYNHKVVGNSAVKTEAMDSACLPGLGCDTEGDLGCTVTSAANTFS